MSVLKGYIKADTYFNELSKELQDELTTTMDRLQVEQNEALHENDIQMIQEFNKIDTTFQEECQRAVLNGLPLDIKSLSKSIEKQKQRVLNERHKKDEVVQQKYQSLMVEFLNNLRIKHAKGR